MTQNCQGPMYFGAVEAYLASFGSRAQGKRFQDVKLPTGLAVRIPSPSRFLKALWCSRVRSARKLHRHMGGARHKSSSFAIVNVRVHTI